MKKVLLAVAMIVGFATADAQELKFGAKAGVNFSTLGGSDVFENKTSFHAGAVLEYKINDQFSIQPELTYSSQGASLNTSKSLGILGGFMGENDSFDLSGLSDKEFEKILSSVDAKFSSGYINLPIMVKFYVIEGLSLQAGPQVGFLVSAKAKASGSVLGQSFSDDVDIKEEFKTVDFGLNFGLGYKFAEKFFVDGRYNLGLTNVAEGNDGKSITNGVFQLSVGYMF